MDLWKDAYRAEFGSDPDLDMAEHAEDVAAWRTSWEGGYAAGEEWATSLVAEEESDPAETGEELDEAS